MTTASTRSPQSVIKELAVPIEALRWRCDPATLGFASTDEVAPLVGTVGQDRGVNAIRFGLAVDKDGFNVYVAGPAGTGRTTSTHALIAELAASRAAPSDWCYLTIFVSPRSLPPSSSAAVGRPVWRTIWRT